MLTSRLALLLAALALALLAGCGDEDDETTTPTPAGATGATGATGAGGATADLGRYCELTEQLDEAGTAAFEDLEDDPDATEADFEAAERQFVDNHEGQLNEIAAVAPDEISDEVGVLIAGVRARAGLEEDGPSDSEQRAAEDTVDAFEKQEC